ncbi:wall-associated receptor kinase 3-like protein [Tanacetum coccineum]
MFVLLGCSRTSPVFDPNEDLCDSGSGLHLCRGFYSCEGVTAGIGLEPNGPISSCCVYQPIIDFASGFGLDLPKLQCSSYASIYGFGGDETGPMKWDFGISLDYNDSYYTENCKNCEASGGFCRFAGFKRSFSCICRGGGNSTTNCYGRGYAWNGTWKHKIQTKITLGEHDWREGIEQYKFIEHCLASVDRQKQPWLIFLAHRVLGYSSTSFYAVDGAFGEPMGRDSLQKLWQKYKVDIAIYGHAHNYERTCPIYEPIIDFASGFGLDLPKLQCSSYASIYGFGGDETDPMKWDFGISLDYNDSYYTENCKNCEASGGFCRFAGFKRSFSCICRGGGNSTTNCYGRGYAWNGTWKHKIQTKITFRTLTLSSFCYISSPHSDGPSFLKFSGGNHEREWPNSGSFYENNDSGGECGVLAETMFYVRAENRAKFWYSTDYGMFRFCIADTEHDWREGTKQYKFIEHCLASVDRQKQPSLIFLAHRVLGYSSTSFYVVDGAFRKPMGRDSL